MAQHVLFPRTFDPPTLGHLDIVQRALALFPRVTIAIAAHPTKEALFSKEDRTALFRACVADYDGAEVVALEGLVVEGCERLGADAILRGVRSGSDYDYEARMAATNRALAPGFETVLLVTSPACAHITSTLVRQIARMGGDASSFVPEPVARALSERFGAQ